MDGDDFYHAALGGVEPQPLAVRGALGEIPHQVPQAVDFLIHGVQAFELVVQELGELQEIHDAPLPFPVWGAVIRGQRVKDGAVRAEHSLCRDEPGDSLHDPSLAVEVCPAFFEEIRETDDPSLILQDRHGALNGESGDFLRDHRAESPEVRGIFERAEEEQHALRLRLAVHGAAVGVIDAPEPNILQGSDCRVGLVLRADQHRDVLGLHSPAGEQVLLILSVSLVPAEELLHLKRRGLGGLFEENVVLRLLRNAAGHNLEGRSDLFPGRRADHEL